jgi:hypothetical protein
MQCSRLASLLAAITIASANAATVDCMDTNAALEYWRPVQADAQTADVPADALALELVSCLGSPNAELRDRIGYELFTFWLRGEKLSVETRRTLLKELSAQMSVQSSNHSDSESLARSFSALILAEIMRADRNQPFLLDAERQKLLDRAIHSIQREDDFRGLDAKLGWVHPVAHMSDLLWRFALHPKTSAIQAEAILAGIRSKAAPTAVSYSFNESDRLARVVTTLVLTGKVETQKMASWIQSFETPKSMEKWSDAFASPQGMAELHNTKLFLRALSDQLDGADVDPAITEQLESLVRGFTQLI